MASVQNISKYKQGMALKAIKKDLEQLIPVVNTVINSFTPYKHYIPIASIVAHATEQKSILEIHLDKVKKQIEELRRE